MYINTLCSNIFGGVGVVNLSVTVGIETVFKSNRGTLEIAFSLQTKLISKTYNINEDKLFNSC